MKDNAQNNQSANETFLTQLTSEIKMAAASIPSTSGIKQTPTNNKEEERVRPSTIEELLIQIENHLYKSAEHRASLLISVWSCLGGIVGYFRNIEKVFRLLYRESAMMIFGGHWASMNILYKRGLARAVIQYSQTMGKYVKGSEGLCSALVMAVYDPWGDPVIRRLLSQEDIESNLVKEFISSEPHELLLIRIECLVNANFEEAAIRLLRCSLQSVSAFSVHNDECDNEKNWKWSYMEWLLRLLFRKRRLNDIISESSSCSCHDGVRLIYRTFHSSVEDSEPLTETLINLFLVRDLLFKSNYCCTSELMKLWCEFQAKKQKTVSEIQESARKLLIGHASFSAQFYLFVDILWGKFGIALLPLYLEMYIRGLTSDLNFLEAARQADNKEYVIEIENHMAAMYFKLFTLFNAINKEIALECLMSAFSLDPTKERLEWIKKLSLQISKEKALKSTAASNDTLHKLCNRSGCTRNCIHPAAVKRKAVVMCDQAIQVGDDSFIDFETPQTVSTNNLNVFNNQGSCDIAKQQKPTDKSGKIDIILDNIKEKSSQQIVDERLVNKDLTSDNSIDLLKINDAHICEKNEKVTVKLNEDEIVNKGKNNGDDEVEKGDIDVNSSRLISKKAVDLVENCTIPGDETKSTSSSGFNHLIENSVSLANSEPVGSSVEKLAINCKVDKINNVTSSKVNFAITDQHIKILDKNAIDIQGNNVNDIPINYSIDTRNETLVTSNVTKSTEKNDNCLDSGKEGNICINGFKEIEINDSDQNHVNTCEDKLSGRDKNFQGQLSEKDKSLNPCSIVNNNDGKTLIAPDIQKENNHGVIQLEPPVNSVPQIIKETNKTNSNEIEPMMTRRSYFLKNGYFIPFSHIILDTKLPGISSDLVSDFVIVLESLRNRQLKSSCKWSQIKHLCEDYLENITNARYNMLNMQLNDSVDSEADSTSELTANGLKDFEFHQSNDSVVEDRYADKTHIFRRFMNPDNGADIGTYVNLSDIHCPQIPLEKLFYTDHSSSHAGHKKKHKRHRNHEKNPGKLMLKKIRHGSRAQRELVKRKKKKRRKAKRGKGHTKKHRFTHGKVTKEYVKNKKKKHKLKKKKEGNSGFISGDYCSDFSSAELMRLVKEHSNSYSKVPPTTSKHPHSTALVVASASSSDGSDEPQRKKRKVSFSKKRGRTEKCRDKHKHVKSKSGKRKKTIVVESCKTNLNNEMNGNMDSVNDYSRIVQFSSVKKMEAVQIRQRSVALNLSNVNSKPENKLPSVNPCKTKPQQFPCETSPLERFVQHNFDSYNPEDIMKMQLLMARQQPDVSTIGSTVSSPNNQAVLKYVCSKTTSRLLSVAQTTNVGSDSETSKSPIPVFSARTATQKMPAVLQQPQNLSTNVKHYLIDSNNKPYKIASSSAVSGGALIPVSLAGNAYSDGHNLTGTMLSGSVSYPGTSVSPQVTTFTFPVTSNSLGSKLVGNKIVIPLPSCGHLRSSTPGMALIPSDSSTYAKKTGSQPSSNIIIVKNGNNTQIIQTPQQPCTSRSYVASSKLTPVPRSKNINPVISKTVPKIIKQAAKKLTQPVVKRTAPSISKSVTKKATDLSLPKQVTYSSIANKLSTDISDVSSKVILNSGKIEPSPESLLVQRVIEEAKRAIAESNGDRPLDLKSLLTSKIQVTEEKIPTHVQLENKEIENTTDIEEPSVPEVSISPKPSNNSSTQNENTASEISAPVETKTEVQTEIPSTEVSKPEQSDLFEKYEEEITKIDPTIADQQIAPESLKEESHVLNSVTEQNSLSNSIVKNGADAVVMPASPKIRTPSPEGRPSPKERTPSPEIVETTASELKDEEMDGTNEKHLIDVIKDANVSTSLPSETKISICSSTVSPTTNDSQKELQPIDSSNTSSNLKIPDKTISLSKTESRPSLPEGATRSFTSISDAVRFSLMDMDDATDSVENQVLQAFQVTHESSPSSPAYDNNSTNEGDTGEASPSAVILTTPQNTTTTELNVSRVSQRFESSVHGPESEKFTECQSTVSRTTTWILEDSSLNESSQVMQVQKSPDLDSSGEGKDEEKPKKKKKRRERSDRDLEATHKFWCEICHKGFFSAYNLRRHCRNVHKMNLPRGSSELPFGPKSTSEITFANNSQCHQQVQQSESSSSEVVTPPRMTYVQQSCISPKGAEYMMPSPTRENKTQDFSMKSTTNQHASQIQSSDFQMQTPPRISNQSSSSHVSPVTSTKDFRLPSSTTASTQLSPNKMSTVSKPATSPKFQRLPTSCSTPTVPQMTKISQISHCGQSALQQQRQISQIQSSPLVQPLTGGACQAQQMQAAQCSHFQSNKQIVQQRIEQLQLMHHTGQMPQVQHPSHGIPKQTQIQQYKKCNATQPTSKMSETEQIQQAAQLAQTQQILTNQHLQKLMHIRQNAIAASGAASQLSLGSSLPGIQGSPSKSTTQCFQSQLAAARQAAAVSQLPTPQRSPGTGYPLTSHDSALHQFFPPTVQPGQEQPNCPHSFNAQNVVEFSGSGPSYPTIRLSSETNDGLEDLEQFLLENMPWSGEQSVSHALNQQSGNRPSSADSLTLAIPSQSSISGQNRTGTQSKNKTSITRPKPRKPVVTSCSKNLLGNLGRGVKKKSTKKTSKNIDINCVGPKSDVFSPNSLVNQQAHSLDLMQRQCSKGTSSDIYPSKSSSKNTTIGSVNETDSSDSIQCINVTHNPNSKNVSVGINFNTFSPTEKNMSPLCNPDPNSRLMYGMQSKNSFLDQCNLVNKSCSNLGDSKSSNLCDTNSLHAGSPFAIPAKETMCDSKMTYYRNAASSMCPKRHETAQDIFLGQRNSEKCESETAMQGNVFNIQDSANLNYNQKLGSCQDRKIGESDSTSDNCKESSVPDLQNNLFLGGKTASNESAVSIKMNNVTGVEPGNSALNTDANENKPFLETNCSSVHAEINTQMDQDGLSVEINKNDTSLKISFVAQNMESKNSEVNEPANGFEDNNLNNAASENVEQRNVEGTSITTLSYEETKGKDINFNNVDSKDNMLDSKNVDSTENSSRNEELIKNVEKSELKGTFLENSTNEKTTVVVESEISKDLVPAESEGLEKDACDLPLLDKAKNSIIDEPSKLEFIDNSDEKSHHSNFDDHDKHSSQENKVPNGLSLLSEIKDIENEKKDSVSKYLALRIHKPQAESNVQNQNEKNIQYYITEKSFDVKKTNKNKKKVNKKCPVVNYDTEKTPSKLDINSNIQNLLDNVNKPNEVNGKNSSISYDSEVEEDNIHSEENDIVCLSDKQKHSSEDIPTGRLRLRDTPKTSVKRNCPCCVDSRMPKRCRANGAGSILKLFGTKVPSSNKTKTTLKTKNSQSTHNAKVNTRSSQRLRSRNNAIS
ncbi:c2H2-type domain-containing protein [Nephila pilipes]|uniref:C2H2-type domain-containing protein n=1 Tax=Nephila pilipes TaxID=299642 RepID=A0A8X6PB64_NEPPI|nr:c2H2-type domain-containing protein [Nephila pilipes]